jgi:membrane-anchored protein YejM (alkaline phosphatase superfamily)
VLLVWMLAFAAAYAMSKRGGPARRELPAAALLVAALPVAGYRALDVSRLWRPDTNAILDRYTGYDVSLKMLYDFVSVPATVTDAGLFGYLQRNTNIPQDVPIKPVSVDFVSALSATAGPKPDIYVLVVDSLRRDYLSPFNPKVSFTPAIESFAKESHVFANAFTHYGATGLSEPSIWVGGMMVHKQYVTPFAPMNTLVKLLDAERYANFISRDSILRSIVPPSFDAVDIDAGVGTKDYDLCRSLGVLEERLDARHDDGRPVFAYTQPQNIHVSRITRENASVPAGETYPGFYAPYASRVRHVDGCVGQFVKYLKDRGRYDRSVVVLTADHGDSLGEAGRWGHAYTIFPEIVRIPLIVHLPKGAGANLPARSTDLAFSTDITPTLYDLLGHTPAAASPVLGRSLLQPVPGASGDDWQLLASSYGAVYGTLHGNGRWLYIVDAVNYQDYYYDLENDPAGERNLVTADVRREQQAHIREGVGQINQFYKIEQPSAALTARAAGSER